MEWSSVRNGITQYTPGGQGFVTEFTPELAIPELNNGFIPIWWYRGKALSKPKLSKLGIISFPSSDVRATDLKNHKLPLWFKADMERGQYKVTISLIAEKPCNEVLVFLSRRRLCWRGALSAGQSVTVTGLCDVSPIIPAGGGDAAEGEFVCAEDTSVDITIIGAALTALRIESWKGPMIYLMGDSTVTDQIAHVPYAPGATYAGWGQMLPVYVGEQYCVSNHSHSGLSTETFRSKGHYDVMKQLLNPGDLVLIQFAHNDQKRLHLAPELGYRTNLLAYVEELRAIGAVPVLVTPLARNTWSSSTEYNDMLEPFANVMKAIGHVCKVTVLDLHAAMKKELLQVGMDAARPWFRPCDYTHTNDFGAHMAAGFVAEELCRTGLLQPEKVEPWQVHPPLTVLEPPTGLTPPANEKPLVDYGMIPGPPWPIT